MDIRVVRRFDTAEELVLDVEVKKNVIDEFISQGYEAIVAQRGVQVQPGEDARQACERELSQPIVAELLTNVVMNMSYPFARSQADDVVTVGSPLFTHHGDIASGKPFEYTARWAKLPQVELDSYEPISFTAPARRASDDMVEAQVQRLLEASGRYVRSPEQRAVEAGDVVSLSLRVICNGVAVKGLCFDERTYTTGIGAMPDEFEAEVVGMMPGEQKRFSFQGIADFDEQEQPIMETYDAEVELFTILQMEVPELTDAWVAARVPGCSTVQDFYSFVRTQLDEQLEGEYRHYLNYIASSELAKRFEGHIPDVAYEAMRDEIQAQFDQEAAQQGLTREEYMRQQGTDEQQYSVRMILQVRERLVQSIALDAYARHFKLEVMPEDLDEFFRVSAPPGADAQLRRQLEDSGRMYLAYEGALRLKANDHLVAHANITAAEA